MKKEYMMFWIFPISQCMIVIGNYMALGGFNFLSYAGILLGIVADVILFYVLLHGSEKEKIERDLEVVKYQREAEGVRIKMLEERKEMLLSMREEFEKRLKSINVEMECGNIKVVEKEMKELQEKLEGTKPVSYCQNMIVNAVLDEKKKVCQNMGGIMKVEMIVPGKLRIEPLHICSIFANLLDNAIEAIGELEKSKRVIEVNAEIKGNYLFIKVKNFTTQEHAKRKRRAGRGNGTDILKNIVQKYHGTYRADYEEGMYTAVLMVKAV